MMMTVENPTTNTTRNPMTTERRQSKREGRLRMSPLELRLYVAALLAVVYTISWRAIGGHGPVTDPPISIAPMTRQPQRVVWIDSLPPSKRPVVTLPAGWQLASEPPSSLARTERLVRVPTRHVPRVRTRSS
jgi:hypothetical protein